MTPAKLYQDIVEQTPDAIIFADPSGVIQLWNAGAEAVFGYTPAEALGTSLDLIIPEELRKLHWSGFGRAMKAGHTKGGRAALPTRSTHKSGKRIYVSLSFSVIHDERGAPIGAMAAGRDITARYLEEKELKKKIAELERRPN